MTRTLLNIACGLFIAALLALQGFKHYSEREDAKMQVARAEQIHRMTPRRVRHWRWHHHHAYPIVTEATK